MSKIYFKDDTEQPNEQIDRGSFVRVPENNRWFGCEFAIVFSDWNGWGIVGLKDGYIYDSWDSLHDMIEELHPQLITKPFVIEPGDPEEDDRDEQESF